LYADTSVNLPYIRSFFDTVPVHFLNLDALVRGGTELRDFRKDCYWSISDGETIFTRMIFRQGKPYYIAGCDCLDSASFLSMIRNDKRELYLSLHFLDDRALGPVIKYLTEEPVLTELDNSSGELVQLLKSLKKSGESGMISLHVHGGVALIPICDGKISKAFLPGETIQGRDLIKFLKSPEGAGIAEFFDGPVAEPAALGIGEINLILSAVNSWLDSLGPVWPQSRSLMPGYVQKIRQKYPALEPLKYEIGEGLSLESFIAESSEFPKAMATLVKSLCRKHPASETAMKLFKKINAERTTALQSTGLMKLLD